MSDTANAAGTEGANGAEGAEGTDATPTVEELTAQLEEWKSNARKHEDRAKANKAAAEELAELKRAQMTDAQKAEADRQAATEALTAATKRAEDAEARLTRYKLAVELELSKEDAAALEQIQGDEATLRALAERLAGKKTPAAKPTRTQGRTTDGTPSAKDAFVDALDGLFD
jgi:seryl-tRNA synthetase